jgi:hypothetical protein
MRPKIQLSPSPQAKPHLSLRARAIIMSLVLGGGLVLAWLLWSGPREENDPPLHTPDITVPAPSVDTTTAPR